VVGEVATLVSIDDGTVLWDNLKYARIQVRIRKSNNASLSKKLRINGKVFRARIIEEIPSQGGDFCKCKCIHYASSDSVSSRDSFVKETIFSVRKSDEGEGSGGEGLWQENTSKRNGQDFYPKETKGGLNYECSSGRGNGVQKEGFSSSPKEVLPVQMDSEGEAGLFVVE